MPMQYLSLAGIGSPQIWNTCVWVGECNGNRGSFLTGVTFFMTPLSRSSDHIINTYWLNRVCPFVRDLMQQPLSLVGVLWLTLVQALYLQNVVTNSLWTAYMLTPSIWLKNVCERSLSLFLYTCLGSKVNQLTLGFTFIFLFPDIVECCFILC